MSIYANLQNCVYSSDIEIPERTDPDFEAKIQAFMEDETKLVNQFKVDLFAHFNVTGNTKADLAFAIAYEQEKGLGLYAVMNLFESLLPLFVETH
jgi:hypothetical protein